MLGPLIPKAQSFSAGALGTLQGLFSPMAGRCQTKSCPFADSTLKAKSLVVLPLNPNASQRPPTERAEGCQ